MRHSIATVTLSGDLSEKLDAAAAAGFAGVEVFDPDLTASPLSPADLRARCDDLGLRIELFQPFRDGEGIPAEEFARTLRRFRHKVALMEQLGVDQVLVCSNVNPWAVDDLDQSAAQVRSLGEVAADHGVQVDFEALAWGTHVNRLSQAWEVVRRADHPSVRLTVDTFHLMSRGDGVEALDDVAPGAIGFLQIADAPRRAENVLSWSRHHRCFPGQGDFDLAPVVARTLDLGYTGPLSLEVFSDVIREAAALDTAMDARRSLILLEQQLRGLDRNGDGSGADRARIEVAGPGDPSVESHVEAIAEPPTDVRPGFVEFLDADGGPVPQLLRGLGFRVAGRHRTKPSTLWSSGDAHVVVSAPQGGTTGVLGLGLSVDDASRLGRRASGLLWRRDRVDRAADETDLMTTSTPSGVQVMGTTGDEWRSDFAADPSPGTDSGPTSDPAAEAPATDVGPADIDHVGYPVAFAGSDAELSYWRTLYGLRPGDISEVNDRRGWMRSRALGVGTPMQVVLNVLEGVTPRARGRVDQVAFGVRDLLETVARARATGVGFLAIPDNYYSDLVARFPLDDDLVARMRDLDVLYDEDADGGVLLHAYTSTVRDAGGGSFYVELLERRGGYRGFGSANTPVRLAAQAREALAAQ